MSDIFVEKKQSLNTDIKDKVVKISKKIGEIKAKQNDLSRRNLLLRIKIQKLFSKVQDIEDAFTAPENKTPSFPLTYQKKTELRNLEIEKRIVFIRESIHLLKNREREIKERAQALIERSYSYLNK